MNLFECVCILERNIKKIDSDQENNKINIKLENNNNIDSYIDFNRSILILIGGRSIVKKT